MTYDTEDTNVGYIIISGLEPKKMIDDNYYRKMAQPPAMVTMVVRLKGVVSVPVSVCVCVGGG